MVTLEQVQNTLGLQFPITTYTYSERDVCLYALGVGAPSDWLDSDELKFVYELSAEFTVLPSFAVIYSGAMIDTLLTGKIGEIEFNPMMLVHGEQHLELKKPLPTSGTITSRTQISNIFDKGSGMVIETESTSCDESGTELAVNRSAMFIRGLGDYGGERGPSSKVNLPPDRAPDKIHMEKTQERQALIYRLSGDVNPLHADPAMAAVGNFDTPILHGLSTFGFAVRAVLKHYGDNDPAQFNGVSVRFSKHVFPGDTLVTEMWKVSDSEIIFQVKSKERDVVVLSNAKATIGN